jgi:hypothetical protein
MKLKQDMITIAKAKLGDQPSVEQLIEFLYAGGSITDRSLRFHVIGSEFFKAMRDTERTARDIEMELAVRRMLAPILEQ